MTGSIWTAVVPSRTTSADNEWMRLRRLAISVEAMVVWGSIGLTMFVGLLLAVQAL